MAASEAAIDLELIRAVVLVAEHYGVEAGRLERQEVPSSAVDQPVWARLRVVAGARLAIAPRWTIAMTGFVSPNRRL